MTTAVVTLPRRRAGLFSPTDSSGRSESADSLARILDDVKTHLWASISISSSLEAALDDLDSVKLEASVPGWDGYGAKAIQTAAYLKAQDFLKTLPVSLPRPDITVGADGEVALDWMFRPGRAMTLSVGASGRLTFAWINGHRSYSGTDWLDDGIPATIVDELARLAHQSRATVGQTSIRNAT